MSSERVGSSIRRSVLGIAVAASIVAASAAWAASTGTTALFMPQGSGTTVASGDFVTSNNPAAPTTGLDTFYRFFIEVPPGLARLRVQIFDADVGAGGAAEATAQRDRSRGAGFNTTVTYTLLRPNGGTAATLTCTNAVSAACADNAWVSLLDSTTAQNTAAGHWELRVDESSTVTAGDDINAVGIRADDGDATSGGTELPVYYDSIAQYGVNPPATGQNSKTYTQYPWVTAGCTARENDFDYDSNQTDNVGTVTLTSRTGSFTQSFVNDVLSVNNTWKQNAINNWTTDSQATDYGVWTLNLTINSYNDPGTGINGNYTDFYVGNSSVATPPTTAAVPNAFRVYLPTDAGTAPVKPYMEQFVRFKSGPNPPLVGQTQRDTVTVRVVNPTAQPITFSATNLVTANVPGAGAVYAGTAQVSQGTVTAQPAVGGTGNITWNPGTLAAGATALLSYNVDIRPTAAGQRIPAVGTVASGNGTRGTWVDETGNTTQARATFTFGPLCEVAVTQNQATWAAVVDVRAARENGRVALRWGTAAEVGTLGFEIERKDAKSGRFVKVSGRMLPALATLPGGSYRWLDESAPAGAATLTYRIVELERGGGRQAYGPYTVAIERERSRSAADASDEPFTARAKGVSARVLRAAVAAARSVPQAGDATPTRVKVATSGAGMVRVDTTAIAAALRRPLAQVAAQLASGQLAVSHLGADVAWQATADGAELAFYAEALASPYTAANVYWIDADRGAGTPIAAEPVAAPLSGATAGGVFAESLHLEENHIAGIASATPVADYWIWKSLLAGYAGFDTADLSIVVPKPMPGDTRLDLTLYGFSGAQEIELRINGRYVANLSWSGPGRYVAEVALPADILRDGANGVEIVARQGSSGIWLDSMDLHYPRALSAVADRLRFSVAAGQPVAIDGFSSPDVQIFDLGDPAQPKLLVGTRVVGDTGGGWTALAVAPSAGPFAATTSAALLRPLAVRGRTEADLHAVGNAAQYVVISPIELFSQASRLAEWRAGQGLSAKAVDLEDVMDEFADGVYDPTAIRRFLAFASQSWSTAPRYVALLGKGSFDYDNNLGLFSNLLPPLLVPTGDAVAPADAEYADFDGSGVPEMAVGRIPALTVAEAGAYVDKLIAYESSAASAWASRALMVADNPDRAGSFQVESDALSSRLDATGIAVDRVYLPPAASYGQLLAARGQVLSGFNAGVGLFNYVGHGGLDRLATEGLLLSSDVAQLGNGPRLPVMTALTCLISQFAYPTFSSLGEDLVLQPGGGVVALYGPTWLSYDGEANRMGGFVVPEIERPGTDRLGDRLLRGLTAYAQAGGDRVQLSVYTLLGDPAVRLPR